MKNIEKMIKEQWFKDHRASIKDYDSIKIINWHKLGTISYSVRYLLDGNKLIVTGDLGEAIFCLTEKAELHKIVKYDIEYLFGKLKAYDGEKYNFDSETAIKRLKHARKHYIEYRMEYNRDTIRALSNEAECCSTVSHWKSIVYRYYDDVCEFDQDCSDWIFEAGNVIPTRVNAYLIGLKMIHDSISLELKELIDAAELELAGR